MMQLVSEYEASRLQVYTLRVAQNGGALILNGDEREDLARILDKVLVGIELDELHCMLQNSKHRRRMLNSYSYAGMPEIKLKEA